MQTDPTAETAAANRAEPPAHAARPGSRWLKVFAIGIVAVAITLVVCVAGLWWWAGTDGSLARALAWVGQSQPLGFERATGSLRAGGRVDRLTWEQSGLSVEVTQLAVTWQPWSLLQRKLVLTEVAAESVTVNDARPPPTQPPAPPTALGLPLAVVIDHFAIGGLRLTRPFEFSATTIAGRYEFDRFVHRLDLANAQVATGRYSGTAALSSSSPLTLDARLSGALQTFVPGSTTPLALSFQATARGPITELLAKAELQMAPQAAVGKNKPAAPAQLKPQATATARILPWATQALAEADATFRDLDAATLWPSLPQTRLTGSASVRPLSSSPASKSPLEQVWQLQTMLTNHLPGPWDRRRLPLDSLEARGEWRSGIALVRALKATLGAGEIVASGEWAGNAPGNASAPAWKMQAALKGINPALLHSQLAALALDGEATVQSQGPAIGFNASVKTKPDADSKAPKTRAGRSRPLTDLRLRDASATGSWNAQQAGGTLALTALRVRTDDAQLNGQFELQPKVQGGKGNLSLTAPGLDAQVKGELRPTSGSGDLALRGRDIAQVLRWLQKLPGMPASLQTASASGNAQLNATWQGGWRDPALQARLDVPSLDWQASTQAPGGDSQPLKIRTAQATLSGRLSQARLSAAGRIDRGARRYALQLAADGGRSDLTWQGLVNQFSVTVEDPALGAGAWRLATRGGVSLKWTPPTTSSSSSTDRTGVFESSAGEAVLSAPSGQLQAAAPSQAQLAWQPVRWQAGELTTAGKLTGLPMAWLDLLAGPQLAGAFLANNLLFDGQWDARLGNKLSIQAGLARSSGDLTVQAETAQGAPVRLAAGIRQARVSLTSNGEDVNVALVWDSERAGTADGQLKTRLSRTAEDAGAGGWLWAEGAPLEGRLRAQLPRIGVWSVLAPPGWRLRGSLATDLRISGTKAAPQLTGDLRADDLALRSVVDGIEFGNGRLRARLDGTRMLIDEFTLQGAGDKGTGGTLTARGEAGWIAGQPQVRLDARLERLRANLRTDRQLTVSGDLQASLAGKQATLGGKLVVDQARIILPEEGTPQLGDDVVVRTGRGTAAGQKAPAQTSEPATAESKPVAVKLAMQIDLGSDFRVQGKGIDTRLRGTLALAGESLRSPRLTGTINTGGGQYRAYGQRLDVEQGVIRFTGAIDNPTLDILAIRPNMMTQRVGVQILGTALLPRVRLYAQPELPDAEKLSWLIVGRSSASGGAEAALLQQAALALLGSKSDGLSGGLAASLGLDELSFRGGASNANGGTTQGAITLGKRFSSNFYAAYERSISGAVGTLFVFYDLSRRFTMRAQAGQQSAIDLIYTVPYD